MSLFHLQETYASREILKHAILLTIHVDYLRVQRQSVSSRNRFSRESRDAHAGGG